MKNLFIILLVIFSININITKAQYVNIPDVNFVAWLNINVPTAMFGSMMDTTNTIVTTGLHFINVSNKSIADLTGIQYFSSLEVLYCDSNSLTTLPKLPVNLERLRCNYNLLQQLPTLPDSLKQLRCSYNLLTVLPTLPSSLSIFYCIMNQITFMPALPNDLTEFSCSDNQLSSLPTLPSSLLYLTCSYNNLSNLPTLPNLLKLLDCSGNPVTTLPALTNSLRQINCVCTNLTSLPTLPDSLITLDCDGSLIMYLPVLPTTLKNLMCQSNQLTSLPTLPDSLCLLNCLSNNIPCFPHFPNTLINPNFFNIGNNPFTCLPNYVLAMDSITLTFPICLAGDTINNIHGCTESNIFKNEYNINSTIRVFPNPVKNNITIENLRNFSQNYNVSIMTLQGQEVFNEKVIFSNTYSFYINGLRNGFYILKLQNEKMYFLSKILIEK